MEINKTSLHALQTLLCCPVLKPHIMGDPLFPGEVTENVSVVQSPMAPPFNVFAAAAVVPPTGPPMLKVLQSRKTKKLYTVFSISR